MFVFSSFPRINYNFFNIRALVYAHTQIAYESMFPSEAETTDRRTSRYRTRLPDDFMIHFNHRGGERRLFKKRSFAGESGAKRSERTNERTNEIDSTGDWKRVSLTKGISHTRQICPSHSSTRDLCARALISQPDTFAITHIVSRNQWKNKNLRSRARTREISIGFSLLLIRLASASIVHKNQISEERFAKSVFFATFLTICVQSVLENWQTGWIEKTDRVEHWINSNDDFMCIIAHSMTANYCFVFTPVIPSAWQWLLTSECPG